MTVNLPFRIKTISQFHQLRGLPTPQHPLISVVDIAGINNFPRDVPKALVADFYFIALKKSLDRGIKIKYGQQEYDFDAGVMSFIAPDQVIGLNIPAGGEFRQSGWLLFIHPDFLWNTPLAQKIRRYEFFDYSVNEALFLSEKEEATVTYLIRHIEQEYQTNIDKFSQDIIIALLESVFGYAQRFYERQFITRKISHHSIINRLDHILDEFFELNQTPGFKIPTVRYIAEQLNVSPGYLGNMLKLLTGKNAQQHIQDKMIEKAKTQLSTTELSVSEIAYALGFSHPQSFSKLFKTKTNLSPKAFRQSFS
jgi:AraC-like DNA-binding protein